MIIPITLRLNKPHEANLVEWFCEGLNLTGAQAGSTPSSGQKSWLIFMAPWQSAEQQGLAPEPGYSISSCVHWAGDQAVWRQVTPPQHRFNLSGYGSEQLWTDVASSLISFVPYFSDLRAAQNIESPAHYGTMWLPGLWTQINSLLNENVENASSRDYFAPGCTKKCNRISTLTF